MSICGDICQYLETFFIVTIVEGEVLLASRKSRPGMLLKIIQCTGQPPQPRIF